MFWSIDGIYPFWMKKGWNLHIQLPFKLKKFQFYKASQTVVSLTVFICTNATGNSQIICRPLSPGSETNNN